MLRDELKRLGLAPRIARPQNALDSAVFTAYVRGGISAECMNGIAALGLECDMNGTLARLRPASSLIRALDSLCRGDMDGADQGILRVYPRPTHLGYEHAALMREFARLAPGIEKGDAPLVARGLRLVEGPSTDTQRTRYQADVRRSAALSLRTGRAGGVLRACAFIIAIGGITYEA